MKVEVIGGGVVGVADGYDLARDGHDAVIVERAHELVTAAIRATGDHIAPKSQRRVGVPAKRLRRCRTRTHQVNDGGRLCRNHRGPDRWAEPRYRPRGHDCRSMSTIPSCR